MTATPDVADKAPPSCGQQGAACPDKMTAAPVVVTKALPFCAACQGLQRQEDGHVELPVHLWDFVAAHGLVHRTVHCPWCQYSAYLFRHSRFRCQRVMTTFVDHRLVTKRCNFDISALKGTFFDHSNLPLKKILCLCYWFVLDTATYEEVMGRVNVPLYRLIYWYTLCQELIITYCLNHCRKIGGPGKTVKIRKARVREKKYCRPSTKCHWVLGGFEEESRSFFLIPLPNLRKETFEECIREWILPGTEIVSDFWGKCASLSLEGYAQKTVHHPASRGIPESSSTPENAEQQPQGSHQSARINTWAQEPFVGQLTLTYFKLTFPDVLQRFHQLLVLAAELYPPQKEECLTQPHVSQEALPTANKKRRKWERTGPMYTNPGEPPVLGNRKPAREEKAAEASIRCEKITVTKVEHTREPPQIEIVITEEKEVTPSAAQDPLALSPRQQPAWEEDATHAQYMQHGMSSYVQSLPVDQREQYISKLRLKKYKMYLPDPYILGGWESDVKLWPDLNFGHIHQYLLCGQGWAAEKKDVGTVAAEGYGTFKLGHVLAVESSRVQSDIPVCFLKARVSPLKSTVAENCDVWVYLEETEGTILASHCTCLAGLTEVCSHVLALLFRVEAATSLGMTCKGLDSDSSKLAVWDRHYRPKKCVACVKDIDFIHPSSSKRLKMSRELQPMPLSQSEQMQALAELKKILPNAPLFMRRDSETDTAPLVGESHQPDLALCQGLATWEMPVRMEDTNVSVKLEADEAPYRTDKPQMPHSLRWSSEGPRTSACFEEPELSVKVEDEIFVKMEEIEEDPYLIESW